MKPDFIDNRDGNTLHRALLEPEHRALERRLVALRELEARLGVCEGP